MSIAVTTQSKASADHKTAAGKQEKKNVPDQFQDMEKPLPSKKLCPIMERRLIVLLYQKVLNSAASGVSACLQR